MDSCELRPYWKTWFSFDWKLGLLLLAMVCIPRFIFVLQASQTGNYGPIGAIMFASALVPFIFLSKSGRWKIGIRSTKRIGTLLVSLALGIFFSLMLYFLGLELYDLTFQNWYVYIGQSYYIPEAISDTDRRTLFLIMAGTGMIFSPIGEELFFRGIVHGSFSNSIGEKKASVVDALAFALTHLAHFGIVFVNGGWQFFFIPAVIWMAGMFLVSLLFIRMKNRSGSLLGAIFGHAGFNLGMIFSIFYLL